MPFGAPCTISTSWRYGTLIMTPKQVLLSEGGRDSKPSHVLLYSHVRQQKPPSNQYPFILTVGHVKVPRSAKVSTTLSWPADHQLSDLPALPLPGSSFSVETAGDQVNNLVAEHSDPIRGCTGTNRYFATHTYHIFRILTYKHGSVNGTGVRR